MQLFALEGTRPLGQRIARAGGFALSGVEEREFADGEHKSRPLVSVRGHDVYVVHTLHGHDRRSPGDRLLRLLFFLANCRDNGAARVTAVVPYMPYLRKDQQTKPLDPVTSRYVATLFEAIGTDVVVGLEVHNVAAFQNAFRCSTLHLDMHAAFAAEVAALAGPDPVVFLSPDSGGMRRARHLCTTYEGLGLGSAGLAMMEKHRSDDTLSGELFAGEVRDAVVVIVDDILATGATMLRAAQACRARGAKRVYALATHGLFSRGAAGVFSSGAIDRVLVSDSIGSPRMPASAKAKLQIVGSAPVLAQAIGRLASSFPGAPVTGVELPLD
jgi:ribose-phosphate pyrophosphokinase